MKFSTCLGMSATLALATVAFAQPACPATGINPVSLTNIGTGDATGAAGNTHITSSITGGWTSTDVIQKIHVSGRLNSVISGTYADVIDEGAAGLPRRFYRARYVP